MCSRLALLVQPARHHVAQRAAALHALAGDHQDAAAAGRLGGGQEAAQRPMGLAPGCARAGRGSARCSTWPRFRRSQVRRSRPTGRCGSSAGRGAARLAHCGPAFAASGAGGRAGSDRRARRRALAVAARSSPMARRHSASSSAVGRRGRLTALPLARPAARRPAARTAGAVRARRAASVCSMSPVRDGPVMKLTERGSAPAHRAQQVPGRPRRRRTIRSAESTTSWSRAGRRASSASPAPSSSISVPVSAMPAIRQGQPDRVADRPRRPRCMRSMVAVASRPARAADRAPWPGAAAGCAGADRRSTAAGRSSVAVAAARTVACTASAWAANSLIRPSRSSSAARRDQVGARARSGAAARRGAAALGVAPAAERPAQRGRAPHRARPRSPIVPPRARHSAWKVGPCGAGRSRVPVQPPASGSARKRPARRPSRPSSADRERARRA